MSDRDYAIVPYEKRFHDGVLALQQHLWGPNGQANAAYFEWKYLRNPYTERPHIYLALHKGTVIGMRGLYGCRWQCGANETVSGTLCAGDLVLHPDHRGHGLFTRIMALAEADVEREQLCWLLNFSASVPTRLSSLSMGWRSTGPLAAMRRERSRPAAGRVARFLRRIGHVRPNRPPGAFRRIDRERVRREFPNRITSTDKPAPARMADLVRRLGHDGRIRHVRDEEYFAWRLGNPRSAYRFFFLGDNPLDGFLVLQTRLFAEQPGPVRIVDCEGATAAARAELFAAASASIEEAALEIWAGTRDDEDRAALARLGFDEMPAASAADRYATILVRPLGAARTARPWKMAGLDPLRLTSWDVRLLDSDAS